MIPQMQGSYEWLEWRKKRIGASDSAAIMGISPYKTAYRLWEEKLGLRDPETTNERMQRGIDLEPKARACFETMISMEVTPRVFEHQEYSWMVASLDGFGETEQGNTFAVEIKCNGAKNHQEAIEGRIPEHYQCQMQHQMSVTKLQWMYYFSFDGENGIVLTLPRDDRFIENLIEKEKEFYRCMQTFTPPISKYKKVQDPKGIQVLLQLKDVISQVKWLDERKEDLKNQLINMYEGENCEGEGIKLSKVVSKGTVDYKSIPELVGIDLEKYRKKPTEYWKITQDKEK